jgi:S-adenosylmethionine-dependent methyltransferase
LGVLDRRPDEALATLEASVVHTTVFDVDVRRYPVASLQQWLQDVGLERVAHYGVRCVNDYILGNELKHQPAFLASLERLELALSGRDPFRQIARGTHLVARRPL